jgi:folate-binding protein YgfZ
MTDPVLSPDTRCAPAQGRAILRVTGDDRLAFLQGQMTQAIERVTQDGIAYGAMLTPQGKLVADFLMIDAGEAVLIDVAEFLADGLAQRLTMFKLRAKVTIAREDMAITCGLGPAPEGALKDPRDPALGWRLYGAALTQGAPIDWDAVRIAARVPETGAELQPGGSFILELDFERLHGVDFRKGCYVGQEVTARMHHKTDLRRGLMRVSVSEPVPPGTAVVTAEGKDVGTLYTQAGGQGLALLRTDRLGGPLKAGEAQVTVETPT